MVIRVPDPLTITLAMEMVNGLEMTLPPPIPTLTLGELRELQYAKSLLENPGLTARLANVVGRPLERSLELLPMGASATIHKVAESALLRALGAAMVTLNHRRVKPASERFHKFLVGASGGVGGAFGMAALPFELPFSTTVMLRSIADIARSEGHNLASPAVKLACLQVFAFGGRTNTDDAAESSYWAVRAGMAKAISEAASYLARRGLVEHTAPVVLRLVSTIAARFGVIVSEQVAAKMIPVIGAAGGSLVNVLFMDHFQDMARGHFIVERLVARHGRAVVQGAYESLGPSK